MGWSALVTMLIWLPQQMVIQVLYAAKPRDPITVGFHQEDDPQVGAAVLHIIQNIVKRLFFQPDIDRAAVAV